MNNMDKWIPAEEGLEKYRYMSNVWGWSKGNDVTAWMKGGARYYSYLQWDSSNQPTHVMLVGDSYPNQKSPEPPVVF